MGKVNKKPIKAPAKLSRSLIVLISIAGFLLLLIGVFWLGSYVREKQTISELSVASIEVKRIYDHMLGLTGEEVKASTFENKCSEASVEIGRGRIVCAAEGSIVLKADIGLEKAAQVLETSASDNLLNSNSKANIYNQNSYSVVSIGYKSPYKDMTCDGSYSQILSTKLWSYTIGCRKDVPDFLPGYTVEK